MLTKFTVVIISQYLQRLNHYRVHLKQMLHVNYIPIFKGHNKKGKGNLWNGRIYLGKKKKRFT